MKIEEQEKKALNELAEFSRGMASVFRFPPEITKELILTYWNVINEYNLKVIDLKDAFQSLARKQQNYPSIMDLKQELAEKIDMNREATVKYYFPVMEKVNACKCDLARISGCYFSGSIFAVIPEDRLQNAIETALKHKDNKHYYEVCYLKLFQQGIKIPEPVMTMENLWIFAGAKKIDTKDFNLHQYINQLVNKMRMK